MIPGLPLQFGQTSPAIADLRRRLTELDLPSEPDPPHTFGPATEQAVRSFQRARGLEIDGRCGHQTWRALEDAGRRLGDRLLYLTAPMLRGDDVQQLQAALGSLGFDAGWIDGILGPDTAAALVEFQINTGLNGDGIFGPASHRALSRLTGRTGPAHPVASLKEAASLAGRSHAVSDHRVLVSDPGGSAPVADAIAGRLIRAGARAIAVHDPDPSARAAMANRFDASIVYSLRSQTAAGVVHSYYRGPSFQSTGGRRLAELVCIAMDEALPVPGEVVGGQAPLLKETRMATVESRVGPAGTLVRNTPAIADAVVVAITEWCTDSNS